MIKLKATKKFLKDLKLAKKRGYNLQLLNQVIKKLLCKQKLDSKYKDHALKGNYFGLRECHIQPDWLLIYSIDSEKLVLTAVRTGTHSDLF